MPKKRKNSKGSELEELKWELRKRGVRPTGSQQAMVIVFYKYIYNNKINIINYPVKCCFAFFYQIITRLCI